MKRESKVIAGLLGAAAAIVFGIVFSVLTMTASADGGDFSLDFIAAAPETYVHQGAGEGNETSSGALQYDARDINTHVRESLEAEDFNCGDRVVYLTQVTVDSGASGTQSIELHYDFDAQNNGQVGVGYRQVLAAGLSDADFAGQSQETGHSRSGNESVSLVSQQYSPGGGAPPAGFGTSAAEHLLATVRVTGLQGREVVIVRVDVRFACFASDPTGNLHAAISSAEVVAGGQGTINVGQQDIPMLGLGELPQEPTNTPTRTPTRTPTNTPVHTPTRTPTRTPTNTPTNTPVATATPTNTPAHTPTDTPTPTHTPTPTRTSEVLPTVVTPSRNIPGDVNCDGKVNSRDALMILQLNAGLKNTLPCIKNADVNQDGRINAIDAELILQFHAGLLGRLPV